MSLPSASDIRDLQLFDNDGHPLQLDAFQQVCLDICKMNVQEFTNEQQLRELSSALLIVAAIYHKQLRHYLLRRKQHCHVVIWFALGRLFALQTDLSHTQLPIDWSNSCVSLYVHAVNEAPYQSHWTALQCRIIIHALSLYFETEPSTVLLNPLWWQGIENLHARVVTLLGPEIKNAPIADTLGVLDIYAIFMDCYYVRYGLTHWLCNEKEDAEALAIPQTVGSSAQFQNVTRACEAWILQQAAASDDTEIPPQVIQTLHEQAVRVGDEGLYFRANTLTPREINPQFCLEVCRTHSAFTWWFQEERYVPVREQLQKIQPGMTPRMRAIMALYVFDQWFVTRYGVSWYSIACRDETALLNSDSTDRCAVQLVFCGCGFFVHYQQEQTTHVLLCDNVFAALCLWLYHTCEILDHAAEVSYQGRLHRFDGLSELLTQWTHSL